MKKAIGAIILLCNFFMAFSQINLEGVVKSKQSNEGISYVNLGLIGIGIGTVSNKEGNFYLSLKNKHFNDSIKISMVGFESKTYLVDNLRKILKSSNEIYLAEKIEILEEVIVSNRKLKTKILGNRSKSRKNLYEASADFLGSEIGVKIKIKRSPTLVKRFNTKVLTRKHSQFKFRLNMYSEKDGLPDSNILGENIIIDAKDIKDGFIDVDLEPYNIYVKDNFFITLEWIQGNDNRKLQFPASLLGPTIVERETSQGKWNKHTVASIGFNVTVQY